MILVEISDDDDKEEEEEVEESADADADEEEGGQSPGQLPESGSAAAVPAPSLLDETSTPAADASRNRARRASRGE